MAKHEFRLISGLAKLTLETKIMAEMQLVANTFSRNMAEQCSLYCCPLLRTMTHAALSMTTKTFL